MTKQNSTVSKAVMPTRDDILLLKQQGFKYDSIFEMEVGNLGLYAIAFFGHKSTRDQRSQIDRLRKLINKEFA